jgi:hypothetical protein
MSKSLYYILLIMLFSINSFSQINLSNIREDLPKLAGSNSSGKEFWFSIPPCYEDESVGHDNFVKVFITSTVKTLVKLEVPGRIYQQTKMTIANDVIEFNIPAQVAQPFSKGGKEPAPPDQVYKGYGFHITADQPIIVYVVVRYWYTSDGFLAIPISALGTEYISASYPDMSAMYGGYYFPSEVTITAPYPETKVAFTLGGNPNTKTASGTLPGETVYATLQSGDVWAISSKGAEADLTGSKIISNKPISVISGNQCTNIPTNNRWCDYTVEADLPTYTWGTEYHVGKIPNRKFPSIIRIFAKEPNTKVFIDGKEVGLLTKSGGKIGEAYLDMRMSSKSEQPKSVVVTGNKPIAVTFYNCGVEEDGYPYVNSDPFVMSMTPVQQYQKEILICTPGVNGSGFPDNYINLVYETDELGTIPEDLEFAEKDNGNFKWYKIRSKFSGLDESFKYDLNGKKYALKTIKLPKDGIYKIRAKNPFSAYSFGYSNFDSYGYQAFAGLADLEKIDTLPPVPKYLQLCNGDIKDAIVEDKPDDASYRSNLGLIYMYNDSSYNYKFSYDEFIPGANSSTKWNLEVIDKSKIARAIINFTDRRGNDTTIIINYDAPNVKIVPNLIDFGKTKKDEIKTNQFEIVNLSNKNFTIYEIKTRSGKNYLELSGLNFPIIVPPLSTYKVPFKFTALYKGIFNDAIIITDSCQNDLICEVKANIIDKVELSIIPTIADFGSLAKDSNVSKPFYIKNDSFDKVTISKLILKSGKNGFAINGASTPFDLAANDSLKFLVDFSNNQIGVYFDTILVNDQNYDYELSWLTAKVEIKTDVEESFSEELSCIINPNPSNGEISIEINSNFDKTATISLLDFSGNEIKKLELNRLKTGKNFIKENFKELESGVYYIRIRTNKSDKIEKFIIIK